MGLASVLIFLITQIILLANCISTVNRHEKLIEKLALAFEAHTSNSTLHRTPDFEKRLDEFKEILYDIRDDLETLLRKEKEK
jgi:hypothetical protein